MATGLFPQLHFISDHGENMLRSCRCAQKPTGASVPLQLLANLNSTKLVTLNLLQAHGSDPLTKQKPADKSLAHKHKTQNIQTVMFV
jgi:hypothetical protein